MKTYTFLLTVILFFLIPKAHAINYVTLTDDCPVVTFTEANLNKISTYKKNVKVQRTELYVYVTLINEGNQVFSWNAAQATAYGGRTLTTLYAYFLDLIQEPC